MDWYQSVARGTADPILSFFNLIGADKYEGFCSVYTDCALLSSVSRQRQCLAAEHAEVHHSAATDTEGQDTKAKGHSDTELA